MLAELNEVDDWFTFGVALGVTVRKLREIKTSNPQGGVRHWTIDMFQSWLDLTSTASWEDIIRALEQADHVVLATRLRSKYTGQQLSPGMCMCSNNYPFITIMFRVCKMKGQYSVSVQL